jgi:hypothetical protein
MGWQESVNTLRHGQMHRHGAAKKIGTAWRQQVSSCCHANIHDCMTLRVPLVSSYDLFQMILISPLIAMTSKLSYPVAPVLLKAQHRQQKAAQLLQNHFRGWRARRLGSTWSWFCVAGNS